MPPTLRPFVVKKSRHTLHHPPQCKGLALYAIQFRWSSHFVWNLVVTVFPARFITCLSSIELGGGRQLFSRNCIFSAWLRESTTAWSMISLTLYGAAVTGPWSSPWLKFSMKCRKKVIIGDAHFTINRLCAASWMEEQKLRVIISIWKSKSHAIAMAEQTDLAWTTTMQRH